jgi:L-ascorbate metabolism protein UlaG (beta-lactamase superfamily)
VKRATEHRFTEKDLIGAGNGAGNFTLDELTKSDHILISHSHFGHVLAIGERRVEMLPAVHTVPNPALAKISSHLCPSLLGKELIQLEGSVAVHITHIKPGEVEAVMGQIGGLGSRHRIAALASGHVIKLDDH